MGRKEAIAKAREGESFRLLARYNQDEFIKDNIDSLLERAGRYFEEAIQEDDNYAWAWSHWGATLSYRGGTLKRLNDQKFEYYQQADEKFDQALQRNPNYAWALAHRGENNTWWAIAERPRNDQQKVKILLSNAKTYLDKAIDIDPSYTWAFARRGSVYRFLGHLKGEDTTPEQPNYDEAIKDFSRAIELNNKYAWAIAFRAAIHRQKARALEINGNQAGALEQWKLTYLDIEKSLKTYINVFKRPTVLDIGEVFLPPSASFLAANLNRPTLTANLNPSPSERYARLAHRVYEEGYEKINPEEINQVLTAIAEEWARVD